MIGSVAMMLEDSFGMVHESKNVWSAMQSVFADGYSTPDLSKARHWREDDQDARVWR